MTFISRPAAAGLVLLCAIAPVEAAPRVWISPFGCDDNFCGSTFKPCLTLAKALSQVDPGGEIDVKDPGDFGPGVVTKAVSIINHSGGTATIGTTSGYVLIVAAAANDDVFLDGLTLNGFKTASRGVSFTGGKSLHVRNSIVKNFTFAGVWVDAADVTVSNVIIDNSTFTENYNGVSVRGNKSVVNATIRNSVFMHNSFTAVNNTGVSFMSIFDSTAMANLAAFGIHGASARLYLGGNKIVSNVAGVKIVEGATAASFGDNSFTENKTDVSGGALATVVKK